MIRSSIAIYLALVAISGCAGPEILEPIDGTVPEGLDLTGTWQRREIDADERRRLREAIRNTDGVEDERFTVSRSQASTGGSRSRNSKAGLVHVFLETGAQLKITQTSHALFVSFDRSVVEEFRFGENRRISVGEVQAQRVTGWRNDRLTVETIDRNRMKLTEQYGLRNNHQILQRIITFRGRNMAEETIIQEFDRID